MIQHTFTIVVNDYEDRPIQTVEGLLDICFNDLSHVDLCLESFSHSKSKVVEDD